MNFEGLTMDELKLMEGNERQHVEARIKALRNIQTLLDAAVIQVSNTLFARIFLVSQISIKIRKYKFRKFPIW